MKNRPAPKTHSYPIFNHYDGLFEDGFRALITAAIK